MYSRIALIVSFFIFFSCKKPQERNCLKSTGSIISQQRHLLPFNTVRLEDDIDLILKQDSFFRADIESPENLIDFISTEQIGDTLFIKDRNRCNWLRNYKRKTTVYLFFSHLRKIHFAGTGKIISDDSVRTDRFSITIDGASGSINIKLNAKLWTQCSIWSGSADVTVSGKTGKNYLKSAGTGVFHFYELNAAYSNVVSKGTGDIYLTATDSMEVEIYHVGSVFYKGDPVIKRQVVEGEGTLMKI